MVSLSRTRKRRSVSLTPMIDVVFLLLVFFMLASRFGLDQFIELGGASAAANAAYSGPPRIVDVLPDGQRVNGALQSQSEMLETLQSLTSSPADTIILRARDGAILQRVVDTAEVLKASGFERMVLAE